MLKWVWSWPADHFSSPRPSTEHAVITKTLEEKAELALHPLWSQQLSLHLPLLSWQASFSPSQVCAFSTSFSPPFSLHILMQCSLKHRNWSGTCLGHPLGRTLCIQTLCLYTWSTWCNKLHWKRLQVSPEMISECYDANDLQKWVSIKTYILPTVTYIFRMAPAVRTYLNIKAFYHR